MRYCAHAPQTGGKTVPNPGRTQLGGKIIHHPTVLYPLKRVTKFHMLYLSSYSANTVCSKTTCLYHKHIQKFKETHFLRQQYNPSKTEKIKGAFFPLDMKKTFIYSPHEATHTTTCSTQYIWMRTDTGFSHRIPYDTIPPGNLCVMPTAFS